MGTTATSRAPKAARDAWEGAIRNLPDLPYKVETNPQGQLILSPPPGSRHAKLQICIGAQLMSLLGSKGDAGGEIGVETAIGVLAPDVFWISTERDAELGEVTAYPVAPEICVEVMSPPNTEEEMEQKRQAYLEAGAEEVWIADESGTVRFFTGEGEQEASSLAPSFPSSL